MFLCEKGNSTTFPALRLPLSPTIMPPQRSCQRTVNAYLSFIILANFRHIGSSVKSQGSTQIQGGCVSLLIFGIQ